LASQTPSNHLGDYLKATILAPATRPLATLTASGSREI
jgi:hypothetical protein